MSIEFQQPPQDLQLLQFHLLIKTMTYSRDQISTSRIYFNILTPHIYSDLVDAKLDLLGKWAQNWTFIKNRYLIFLIINLFISKKWKQSWQNISKYLEKEVKLILIENTTKRQRPAASWICTWWLCETKIPTYLSWPTYKIQ